MDPVTIGAVLAAVAAGAGGALGSQVWAGVTALVRRPFCHAEKTGPGLVPNGRAELSALEQSPSDELKAVALAEVLVARANLDVGFRRAMQAWWEQARLIRVGDGTVFNMVSGGTQHGPVLQGRDFSGVRFSPAPHEPPAGQRSRAPDGQ